VVEASQAVTAEGAAAERSKVSPRLQDYRRAQILCAAVQVVAAQGVDKARLKDISDMAGVSLGMVQHYFRTREELMAQTFQVMMSVSLLSWNRLASTEPDPLVSLFAGMRLHVVGSVTFAHRWGFWSELWSGARRDEMLAEIAHQIYQQWNEPFHDLIAELIATNRITVNGSAEHMSMILMALIDGLAARSLVDPESLPADAIYARLVETASVLLQIEPRDAGHASELARTIVEQGSFTEELSPTLFLRVLTD
jgi:TetR/AcrR family transcriptional regulator, transcriptional repressor of bet genes